MRKLLASTLAGWTLFLSTMDGGLAKVKYGYNSKDDCMKAFEQSVSKERPRYIQYICVPDPYSLDAAEDE